VADAVRRSLVIDASVAAAAGSPGAEDTGSKACHATLEAALRICHRMVLADAIVREWRRHESTFALRFRTEMLMRDAKTHPVSSAQDQGLRESLLAAERDTQQHEALLKDAHLIEAALRADCIIISCDGKARRRLARVASHVDELADIVWVDPVERQADWVVSWLEDGARPSDELKLSA
jgi:hypothetical protein